VSRKNLGKNSGTPVRGERDNSRRQFRVMFFLPGENNSPEFFCKRKAFGRIFCCYTAGIVTFHCISHFPARFKVIRIHAIASFNNVFLIFVALKKNRAGARTPQNNHARPYLASHLSKYITVHTHFPPPGKVISGTIRPDLTVIFLRKVKYGFSINRRTTDDEGNGAQICG